MTGDTGGPASPAGRSALAARRPRTAGLALPGRTLGFLAALLALAAAGAAASEGERITSFESRIAVDATGGLEVAESISVVAAGGAIRRGIYRDFPTIYDGPLGTRIRIPFEIVSAERDGRPEPFHAEPVDNGVRIYLGSADAEVPAGPHVYRLVYRTSRQLGFFEDHDELYWNVTGNGWAFPIDRVTTTVVLPFDARREDVGLEAYTGLQGSRERAFESRVDGATGELRFSTTRPLDDHEGLTIVATFPKGLVRPPSEADRRGDLVRSNLHLLAGLAGMLAVLGYYLFAWLRVGRDPERGTIIPLFEPPEGLDAAGTRYVDRMGWDDRCLAAALVGMAVKGWLRFEEKDGHFVLHRAHERQVPLSGPETKLNAALLGGNESIELVQRNHARIRAGLEALKGELRARYRDRLFRTNGAWLVAGAALSLATVVAMGWLAPLQRLRPAVAFLAIWLGFWTAGCTSLLAGVHRKWGEAIRPGLGAMERIGGVIAALGVSAFAIPFLVGEVVGFAFFGWALSPWALPVLVVLVATNLLLAYLIKAPTPEGRRTMDGIDGFRMYLSATEAADLRDAPARTPEVFEAMLPYAIALGVEHAWTSRFADVLRAAVARGDATATGPAWYTGRSWSDVSEARFGSMLGSSLPGAISSSSTAPGSSSGSGGGGSSGGGGGGGGGGGW